MTDLFSKIDEISTTKQQQKNRIKRQRGGLHRLKMYNMNDPSCFLMRMFVQRLADSLHLHDPNSSVTITLS